MKNETGCQKLKVLCESKYVKKSLEEYLLSCILSSLEKDMEKRTNDRLQKMSIFCWEKCRANEQLFRYTIFSATIIIVMFS